MLETNSQGTDGDATSLGVSVGEGMIHYVLMTLDDAGRTDVTSRVFEVDPTDGLDSVGRVNAGIDLMLDAARAADRRVGPIGVTARTATQRRRLRSGGTGTRRQVYLSSDEEAVAEYLTRTGQIDRFTAVVVADCGDTGMSLYTVDPAAGTIASIERTVVISGRALDRSLADHVAAQSVSVGREAQTRRGRELLVGACRTAKEEIGDAVPASGAGGLRLTRAAVAEAAAPMVADARGVFTRYVSAVGRRGPAPDAVVLVGGLANLPVIHELAGDVDLEVLVPPSPEIVAATGAAMLASSSSSTGGLGFIGGHRGSRWSLAPAALVGCLIAAVVMAAVAVGATLSTGDSPAPTSTEGAEEVATTDYTGWTSTTRSTTSAEISAVLPPTIAPPPGGFQSPGWATTELPQTTISATTLTLVPNTPSTTTASPNVTSPSTTTPTTPPPLPIPSQWLPPGLLPLMPPQTSTPAPDTPDLTPYPVPAPRQQAVPSAAPTTTTTPAG
ncbi:Hsp70 family protein [Gordonia sp. NPDC003950]